MTIYNIISDFTALTNLVEGAMTDQETGEVRELTDEEKNDFLEWFNEHKDNLETKFNNICKVYKNIQSQADIAKAEKDTLNSEIDRLRRNEKARNNEAARVKGLISFAFDKLNLNKYKTPLFNAYFMQTKKCARPRTGYFDPDNIPVEFLTRELSASAIDKAVKEGILYEKDDQLNRGKLFYVDSGIEKELQGVSYLGGETLVIK